MLAQKLGWHLLDSGAIYRVLAYAASKNGIDLADEDNVAKFASKINVVFKPSIEGEPPRIILAGEDISDFVRTEDCGKLASRIAAYPKVREALVAFQESFRQKPGLVTDGRDMGTVVFPDAVVKFYLTASVEERAKRRHKQLKAQNIDVKLAALVQELSKRDARDQGRAISPLKAADDAIIIDTTNLSIEEVMQRVLSVFGSHKN